RGGFQQRDMGPPAAVIEMGKFMHACEGEMVCESINPKVPQFNAQIFLENKTPIGKVDEILGPINEVYFTVKPTEGIQAGSFKEGDKFYISTEKLLPMERFLPKPKPLSGAARVKKPSRGGPGGFSRADAAAAAASPEVVVVPRGVVLGAVAAAAGEAAAVLAGAEAVVVSRGAAAAVEGDAAAAVSAGEAVVASKRPLWLGASSPVARFLDYHLAALMPSVLA
ncbi:unnamed protein product, partial [Parascedosporium putredinis]